MKKVFVFLLIGLMCVSFASAHWWDIFHDHEDGSIVMPPNLVTILNQEKWVVTEPSKDWNIDIKEPHKQNGEICFFSTSAKGVGDIDNEKQLYLDDKQITSTTLSKTSKLSTSGTNYGYCYTPNKEKYLKINPVVEYQNESKIQYTYEWGQTNFTTLRNNGSSTNVNNLSISWNNVSYKTIAVDDLLEEGVLQNYTLLVESSEPLKTKRANIWYTQFENLTIEKSNAYFQTQEFNFNDICSRQFNPYNITIDGENYTAYNDSADCSYNYKQEGELYILEINFTSDKYIDPELKNGTIKIKITSAEHLNSTRGFIEDIFGYVNEYDNNFTDYIPVGDYVRVTFAKNLSSVNDITTIAQSSGLSNIEIYQEGINETVCFEGECFNTAIAKINNIGKLDVYQTYLTHLYQPQDTFYLKILNDSIRFDYIVDPITIPNGYNLANDSLNFGTFEGLFATSEITGANFGMQNLHDGVMGLSTGDIWFSSTSDVTDVNITINFTDSYNFDTLMYQLGSGTEERFPNKTRVWVSDDAVSWTNVTGVVLTNEGVVPNNEVPMERITFADQTKRYVRLEIIDNMGDASFISINEIHVLKNTTNLANLSTTTITSTANPSNADKLGDENWNIGTFATSTSTTNYTWNFSESKNVELLSYYPLSTDVANYSIYISDDGTTWTEIISKTGLTDDTNVLLSINFTTQTTQYLRMKHGNHVSTIGAREIQVWEAEPSGIAPELVPNGYNIVNDTLNLGTFEGIEYSLDMTGPASGHDQKISTSTFETGETSLNVTINFTDSYNFDAIQIFGFVTNSPNVTNIYVSDDAESWSKIVTNLILFNGVAPAGSGYDIINFSEQTKRYLRLEFLTNMGSSAIGFQEILVYKNSTNLANSSTTILTTDAVGDDINETRDEKWTTSFIEGTMPYNITWNFDSQKTTSILEWTGYTAGGFELFPGNYTIWTSNDGSSWTNYSDGEFRHTSTDELDDGFMQIINWTKTTSQYLRLQLHDRPDFSTYSYQIRIFEQEAEEDGEDTTPPTSSSDQVNTTIAGQAINFSILWDDETALEPLGQYIFSTNNTGIWVNDSAVNFTATPNWSSVTDNILNSTVGVEVQYLWYATDNASNMNITDTFSLITAIPTIDLTLVNPPNLNDINVTKDEFFNVVVNVTCREANCGDINVSLDPVELGDNAGFVTVAPTGDPEGSSATAEERANAVMDTTSSGDKIVTEMGWYSNAASDEANYEIGIYTDSGGTIPDAVVDIETTNAKGTTEGWKVVSGLNIPISGSTNYWLAIQVDGSNSNLDWTAGGSGHSIKTSPAQTELPNPSWGAEDQGGTLAFSIYALYEELSAKSGLVSSTPGDTPFYTNDTNPRTINLDAGESELVTFFVNATGDIDLDVAHTFFAFANLTFDESINNITGSWDVTINQTAPGGDTCTYTSGDWNVDCSDNCAISSPVDVGGNDINIIGTGSFSTTENIFNFNKLHIRGTDSSNICRVTCLSGGCFT